MEGGVGHTKLHGHHSPWAPFCTLRSWPVHFGTGIGFHRDFPFLWCRLQGTNLICPYISCYIYFSSKLKYVSVKCKFDNKLAYITFYCWIGHIKWSTTTSEASLYQPITTNQNVLPHKSSFLLPNSVNFNRGFMQGSTRYQGSIKYLSLHGTRGTVHKPACSKGELWLSITLTFTLQALTHKPGELLMWFIHSLQLLISSRWLFPFLSPILSHFLPRIQFEKRNCLFLIKLKLWGCFQTELPDAFQETPVHFQECLKEGNRGQILCWNMLIPTLPRAALGAEQAQLRAEFGLNCEFRTGSQHQLNTAHTDLWTAKNVCLEREFIPSSKGNSNFFSKGQGRKQRGDEASGPLLGFYQKQADVIIRLKSLL